ncbi:MAG: enoyl-CoA hydratase/isomerase family protein [Actinobacteria bacterium]|jgi:enoyl-CoA hydratase|nr:MAG: enoyl-CoA hydratase/isomerase family protein [Actinomycetota bacterium]
MGEEREAVIFEKKGRAGWILFSHPERMNALSPTSMRTVWSHLSRLEADAEVRVLVFTGLGESFCAGMDMAGLESATPLAARRRSRELQMLTNRIADLSLPTIAAVNGVAMGAGLEICLACDLVVASAEARFAFPEARLGMIPCGGGTQRLARLVGLRRARDMIFTGRILGAEQALEWGLANEVVPAEELGAAVETLAEKLSMGGRIALYQAKRCLNHSLDMDLNRGLDYETECFTTCFASGEPAAGLRRFAEPSAPEPAAPEPVERETEPEVEVGENSGMEGAGEAAAEVAEEGMAGEEDDEGDDIFE